MALRSECKAVVPGARRRAGSWPLWTYAGLLAAWVAVSLPGSAQAAHNPETIDKVADVLTIVVLIIVPVVGIAVFWLVHVLPERIAEKRLHPQAKAIQTLCLLSLVFGGLLWPIAWLWAYSKPVLYKLAYGTDKVDPHAEEHEAATTAPAFVAASPAAPAASAQVTAHDVTATAAAPAAAAPPAAGAPTSADLLALRDELLAMQLLAMQQRIDRLAGAHGARNDGRSA
jgi:hypothetical protein